MPVSPVQQDTKIKLVTDFIKSSGWRSIEDFFRSSEGLPSLKYLSGKSYGPERILNAWVDSVPSGQSREKLNMAVTQTAAHIMVKESTAAVRERDLGVSSAGLTIPFLAVDFGLREICDLYTSMLPCLFSLLNALLTTPNNYERWNNVEKQGKDEMARQVCGMRLDGFGMRLSRLRKRVTRRARSSQQLTTSATASNATSPVYSAYMAMVES